MKFLFASDSFKGTLSSARIAELLTTAAKESFPDCTCTSIETADGGEGTTDAVLSAVQGQRIPLVVCGPLWKKTDCFYGKLDEERAVMEMAAASGLPLLTEPERDPGKNNYLWNRRNDPGCIGSWFSGYFDRNRRIGDE